VSTTNRQIAVCLELTRAISRARTLDEIFSATLDSVADGLGVSRASIRLLDPDGVMRFKAFRGVSLPYQQAAEGYSAWPPDINGAATVVVSDVTGHQPLTPLLPAMAEEGIAALAGVPLVNVGRVIGKLALYYETPYAPSDDELQLACLIAAEVAFAIERARAEESARRSEERLRYALESALMGTWEWELASQKVTWSDNLEKIHGLPPGTFDGTFASYEREIHPDDRERVLSGLRRAIEDGIPHDVEYRIVAPDGTVRWVEGKGRVEFENGRPVRMAGVCVMVGRRKEAELARLASAEEASRLKDEFLATLSHELRTPLNAILGWAQILQNGQLSSDRERHAIDVIGRNAKLQAQLIEDILDVSRIITGKLAIERRPLSVAQLVDNVLSAALPGAEAKLIQLTRNVPGDLPSIDGDQKRLEQVLGNIVSNAVKFTPERGRVDIRGALEGDTVVIQVRDSGVGIAADFLPYVFDRFRQADSRLARTHGGLGLGLAIARHLIELHGGRITAHSEGPGLGTTLEIHLPARLSAYAAPIDQMPSSSGDVQLNGVSVLVVDDHLDSREFLSIVLGGCGARVLQCDSVASAVETLASTRVDLIVADLGLPAADGYELIDWVRTDPVLRKVPALAVSAYSQPEDHDKALEAGFGAYCPKPVDALELLGVVHRLLNGAKAEAG
jgi:PAS domain S-box-containing protein